MVLSFVFQRANFLEFSAAKLNLLGKLSLFTYYKWHPSETLYINVCVEGFSQKEQSNLASSMPKAGRHLWWMSYTQLQAWPRHTRPGCAKAAHLCWDQGPLVILILVNYMSWHRAVDEVTPWPGTEQLRDLLPPQDRGHLSLTRFYFI